MTRVDTCLMFAMLALILAKLSDGNISTLWSVVSLIWLLGFTLDLLTRRHDRKAHS